MLKEHTPVWVWDGYWWAAYVVLPVLDLEGDLMLVRFENGVTAPVKATGVRYRELVRPSAPSTGHPALPQRGQRPRAQVSSNVFAASAPVDVKSNLGFIL